ncbi:PREDICTED: O-glucosyltransferase rumi homolog [Vollenhovia emeryi]|uniref:O-glucosyltransferase rumi homolog n=1 Tax=Vollenhovia emeryi TaxID=411798 RepID=UPI0005F4464E|nr:PREDICTED: O-glucosyltransferase rumi homolog [Vollenhovia emeryi]
MSPGTNWKPSRKSTLRQSNMLTLIYLMLFAIVAACLCQEQFCSVDATNDARSCKESENVDHRKSLYTKGGGTSERYEKYLAAIRNAELNYEECNNTKHQCFRDVISRDLRPFRKKGISEEMIEAARTRGTFYQIIKGKLYREKDCMFPARCAGIEHFLLKIIANLSDMDLVINTRDYPQSSEYFGNAMPIFSFSKTPQYYDIMYPAWAFWEGGPAISLYPRGLGRWDRHRNSLNKASLEIPWEKKESRGFFRGSRTSSERDDLILLSRNKPHLVDARYTKNQAWKSNEDTLHATPASEVSLESHCAYKYLFNFRGVAASFRHKHLFLCRSLVFHVGDEWLEFYYYAMKPWLHYIPVPKNAHRQELEDLIEFAQNNDHLSKKIAYRGRDFIWNNLRMADVTYFWQQLLTRYGKLLVYKPVLKQDLVNIKEK